MHVNCPLNSEITLGATGLFCLYSISATQSRFLFFTPEKGDEGSRLSTSQVIYIAFFSHPFLYSQFFFSLGAPPSPSLYYIFTNLPEYLGGCKLRWY